MKKMWKKKGKFWRGSYTVEAAVIMSITILVLGTLIFAIFYAHDRAVFQSIVCEMAAAGSSCATENEQTKAVDAVKKQVKASRFLGSQELTGSAAVGEDQVSASWSAVYPVPGFAMKYLAGGELSIETSWNSMIAAPVDTIRLIRGAGELITGGDD
ncbi:MAG: hypothetical protein LIO94_04170 [Clostridiales bacterium]|nr:hypothetical protein [Clostridiales bacterium]